MTETTSLEEKLSYCERTIDDLSSIVAQQANELDILKRRVALLIDSEKERTLADAPGIVVGDERPPHW